jgi:hypothetical protein
MKAQFYLISVIILVAIIASFFTISNYSKTEKISKINEFKQEYETETWNILNHAAYNNLSNTQTRGLLDNFTKTYLEYTLENIEIIFIFGDEDELKTNYYYKNQLPKTEDTQFKSKINIKYNDIEKSFDMNSGINFHFMIIERKGGEQFISVS